MSSFRDNFKREDEGDRLLDYDDSAFYYFFISVALIFAVPASYSIFKTLVFGNGEIFQVKKFKNC